MLDRCVPLIMIDLQQGATAYRSQQAKLALITCGGGPFCLRLPVRCSFKRGPFIAAVGRIAVPSDYAACCSKSSSGVTSGSPQRKQCVSRKSDIA
jgi:hypothetical protein